MPEKYHHLVALAKSYLAEGAPCSNERIVRALALITAMSEALMQYCLSNII